MYIVVGLGNPGLRYRNTRHNAGFSALNVLSEQTGIKINKKKFQGVCGEGSIGGESVVLLKPHTFMNLSGKSVVEVMNFYKLTPDKLIVVYDDIDLEFGRLRIKGSGSAGTHNGMRSIIGLLGYENFPRVRIGIGRPPFDMLLADYVLGKISGDDKKIAEEAYARAAKAVEDIILNGIQHAQAEFNGK